jgi:hypothetical protein
MSKYGNIPHNDFEALLNKMGGQLKMDGEAAMRGVLRDEYRLIPTAKAVNTALAEFFTTKKGLYVHESFTKRVLPFHNDDATSDISSCDAVDLPRNMHDSEIIKEYLGGEEEAKKNAFTLNQMKAFIQAQPNGESGKLLTNDHYNIFYCIGKDGKLFAVSVYWNSADQEWVVRGWELGENDRWRAGRRIFRNKKKEETPFKDAPWWNRKADSEVNTPLTFGGSALPRKL